MAVVHFLLLAAVVVFTLGCLLARGGRARRPFRTVLLAFLPFWLIGVTCMLLLTYDVPTIEWIVPGIAVLLLGLFCTSEALFTVARWGLLMASLLLCADFFALTSRGYTAHPSRTRGVTTAVQRTELRAAAKGLQERHTPDAVLPAGEVGNATVTAIVREWHTPLTRLYRVERKPASVWYPGGKVGEAADRLEVRPAG